MSTNSPVTREPPRTKQGVEEEVRVLQMAFELDPLFKFLFQDENQRKNMDVFFAYMLRKSTMLREETLRIHQNGHPVCVANLELPTSKRNLQMLGSPLFLIETLVLAFKLPRGVFENLNSYMKCTSSARPNLPHHYLTFIGVHPEHQGQGIGKRLLAHIHSLVESDPSSCGIGLDTENRSNVPLYEHLGYKLTAEHKLDATTIHCMFRSK